MGLHETAQAMVAKPKGILAADESTGTIKKRLASVDIESTEETRREYRGMLFTTPRLGQYISGVIMFTETLGQETPDGKPFPKVLEDEGIIPGVKVDLGKDEQPNGEFVTKGLYGIEDRLPKYVEQGARFAKWRAVIQISDELPTDENIEQNASDLAKYAKACQQAGLVPIVEPEVLMEGDHDIERCKEVTVKTLKATFAALEREGVDVKGTVLKPNMVVPGKEAEKATPEEVARETVDALQQCLPDDLPGVAFLSGGIGDDDVTEYLNAMNKNHDTPWNLTFSFGRGLQRPALAAYGTGELEKGQEALLERAEASSKATVGEYGG